MSSTDGVPRGAPTSGSLQVLAPDGVPEVQVGADVAAMIAATLVLEDGDIVLVTSKVLSKAEGRVFSGDRRAALAGESSRLVARAGETNIVRNHLGITMAAAGIDESNLPRGRYALLPSDPDASARERKDWAESDRLRDEIASLGWIVEDTSQGPKLKKS